jgi:hypothetical protein
MRKAVKKKIEEIMIKFLWEQNDTITRERFKTELTEATRIQFEDKTTIEMVVINMAAFDGYDAKTNKIIHLTITPTYESIN